MAVRVRRPAHLALIDRQPSGRRPGVCATAVVIALHELDKRCGLRAPEKRRGTR